MAIIVINRNNKKNSSTGEAGKKVGKKKEEKTKLLDLHKLSEDKFERSKRIKLLDMEAIQSAKVLVVGLGAIGNESVKNLVLSGFKHLVMVDMDYIVRSNLNRCIFFRDIDADKKALKTEVVARGVHDLDDDLDIVTHNKMIQDLGEDFIPQFDLVLGCLDNIDARLHLNAHCYYNKIPYIDAATNGFIGKVQVVLAPETPCLECSMNKTHFKVLRQRFSCTGTDISFFENKMPAEITTTAVVSAIQVKEGIKVISGRKDKCLKNMFYYHGINNMTDEMEIELNPDCPHHF